MTQLSIPVAVPDTVEAVKAYLAVMCNGRDRAKTKRTIAWAVEISEREVESAVEHLRQHHAPIVSGSAGYWWTADPVELRKCRHGLTRRAVNQIRTARAMIPAELDLGGQQHISAAETAEGHS